MGLRNNFLLIFFLIFLFNISCANKSPSCGCSVPVSAKVDATQMPYRSFAFIKSEIVYTPDSCNDDDKLDNGQCNPSVDSYSGSGVFILRSIKTTDVAYFLTARHICDHKDAQPEHGILLLHRFNIRDYYGQLHKGRLLFTSKLYDACIIVVDDVGQSIVMSDVAAEMPKQGERVFNLAAPRGIVGPEMIITFEGFYSGQQISNSIFTVPAVIGSSGSPVFNSRGELVSMLWAVPSEDDGKGGRSQLMENISVGLLLSNIKDMLKSSETIDEIFGPSTKED